MNAQSADDTLRKRQFSRKVDEWGFKKNVTRYERRAILESLRLESHEDVLAVEDRRVKPAKIERWRRQQRNEGHAVQCLPIQDSNVVRIDDSAGSRVETCSVFSAQQNLTEETSEVVSAHKSIEPRGSSSKVLSWDQWPFDWAVVDVPGSPGLSRLFDALEIECSIPPLSLDTGESREPQFISRSEILDLFNKDNKALVYGLGDQQPDREKKLSQPSSETHAMQLPGETVVSAFHHWAFSPLNELYPFPCSRNVISHVRSASWSHSVQLETELQAKLCKLKWSIHPDHPGITSTMEELGWVYFDQRRFAKAEKLFRHVVDARIRTLGPTHIMSLNARMIVIETLIFRRRFREAHCHLENLQPTILKQIGHEHDLASRSMFLMARILKHFGHIEYAEVLCRQVLQIRLQLYGPRDFRTQRAMKDLADVVGRRKRIIEEETLLRSALQLLGNSGPRENMCVVMQNLSFNLCEQKRFEESSSLAQYTVELSKLVFGVGHPEALAAESEFAEILNKQGRCAESVCLLRTIVSQQLELLGDNDRDTLISIGRLAEALMKMDQTQEAIAWGEKAFRGHLETIGPDTAWILRCCYNLEECYKRQKRYADALELYQQLIGSLRTDEVMRINISQWFNLGLTTLGSPI